MGRATDLKRKAHNRKTHSVIVIVCEGQKTEYEYFKQYKEILKEYGLILKPLRGQYTDAVGLIKDTIRQKEIEKPHHIWCAFDRDKNSRQQLDEAQLLAKENSIEIAFSNPCFEIWYLLHFEYTSASFEHCDQLIQDKLSKIPDLKDYKKGNCYFNVLYPKMSEAIQHAKKLAQEHEKLNVKLYSLKSNPSTNIHELIDLLETEKVKKQGNG